MCQQLAEIKELLSSYRLRYSSKETRHIIPTHQLHHNEIFGLDKKSSSANQEDFNLELALDNAFKNLGSPITEYNRACDMDKKSDEKGRDIHDGYHALTTSYYAKKGVKPSSTTNPPKATRRRKK